MIGLRFDFFCLGEKMMKFEIVVHIFVYMGTYVPRYICVYV